MCPILTPRLAQEHPGLMAMLAALVGTLLAWTPTAAGQQMPFAVQSSNGALHIWTVDEPSGMAVSEIDDVTFLSIRLAGHEAMDRLRSDRPTVAGLETPAPHIRLPGGGALYRVQSGVETGLLRVRANGTPELLVSVPSDLAGPALQEHVSVSADGGMLAVATEHDAGGDVILVRLDDGDLASDRLHHVLTAQEAPLRIDASSLRASTQAVWFIASGELHRARPAASRTQHVEFDLLRAEVLPEVVMNRQGTRVAVVVRSQSASAPDAGEHHVFAVDLSEPAQRMSETSGHYGCSNARSLLQSARPMAWNSRGDRLAFRDAQRSFEILTRRIAPAAPLQRGLLAHPGAPAPGTLHSLDFDPADRLQFLEVGGSLWRWDVEQDGSRPAPLSMPSHALNTALNRDVWMEEMVTSPDAQSLFMVARLRTEQGPSFELLELDLRQASDAPISNEPDTLVRGLRTRPVLVPMGTSLLVIAHHGPDSRALSTDAADVQVDVQLLKRRAPDAEPLLLLSANDPKAELSRFAVSPRGRFASFVVETGHELVMPTYLDLMTGALRQAAPNSLRVSPVLAYSSSGSLLVGLGRGRAQGQFTFSSLRTPSNAAITPLPQSYGFPLQH